MMISPFILERRWAGGPSIAPISLTRPYTREAREFVVIYYHQYYNPESGLTQERIASDLGVPRTTLRRWYQQDASRLFPLSL